MKVECTHCGNEFNYKKQEGVCDQCGKYMPVPNPSSKIEKRKKVIKSRQFVACGIIAFFMLLLPFAVAHYTHKEIEEKLALTYAKKLTPVTCSLQEEITIADAVLCVNECKIIEEWEEYVPEGFRLICMLYEVGDFGEFGSGANLSSMKIYLKLPQGEYIEPLLGSSLAEEFGVEHSLLWDTYHMEDGIYLEDGSFFFLVPEDVTNAEFEMYHLSEIDEMWVLDSVYEIP